MLCKKYLQSFLIFVLLFFLGGSFVIAHNYNYTIYWIISIIIISIFIYKKYIKDCKVRGIEK